jgi:hypothetical protein
MVPTVERGLLRGGLLVDRHRRGESFDEVDVGFVHLAEEHPGVGRQGFDVAALALGEDRVEGQRGLAGPGQAGEDDHGVAWQGDLDVFEVVCPRALDPQGVEMGDARHLLTVIGFHHLTTVFLGTDIASFTARGTR